MQPHAFLRKRRRGNHLIVLTQLVDHPCPAANTASASLLSYVAGIGPSLAKKVVAHRDANGSFLNRKSLMKVSGMGARSFEQAAGFLRIRGGDNPLDASAVHPERYKLLTQMASIILYQLVDSLVKL